MVIKRKRVSGRAGGSRIKCMEAGGSGQADAVVGAYRQLRYILQKQKEGSEGERILGRGKEEGRRHFAMVGGGGVSRRSLLR